MATLYRDIIQFSELIIVVVYRVVKMVVMLRGLLVHKTMPSLTMIVMEISPSLMLEEMEDGIILCT